MQDGSRAAEVVARDAEGGEQGVVRGPRDDVEGLTAEGGEGGVDVGGEGGEGEGEEEGGLLGGDEGGYECREGGFAARKKRSSWVQRCSWMFWCW